MRKSIEFSDIKGCLDRPGRRGFTDYDDIRFTPYLLTLGFEDELSERYLIRARKKWVEL